MGKAKKSERPELSPLENDVMQIVWARRKATADDVRSQLEGRHDLKDSTVRTLLRRLEDKGYVEHDVDGRTFVYRARIARQNVASQAVKGIVDQFCSGSLENLLVGLVDDKLISTDKLKELADRIAQAEAMQKQVKSTRHKKE